VYLCPVPGRTVPEITVKYGIGHKNWSGIEAGFYNSCDRLHGGCCKDLAGSFVKTMNGH